MWRCTGCLEEVEGTFGECWNCGRRYDGTENPAFAAALAERDSEPWRVALLRNYSCSRCGYKDAAIGRPRSPMAPFIVDLSPAVYLFRCLRCGNIESRYPDQR